jgi:hypothetical protein
MTRRKSAPSHRTGLRGPGGSPSNPGGRPSTAVEAAAGRDDLPRDHRGFVLQGAARDRYVQRQADINEALAARQAVESLARTVMVLASRMTGLPGPDAVRAIMNTAGADGAGHGMAVVRAAGHSVPAQQAAWQAEAPARRQASRGTDWSTDPDHDPRVMAAITSGAGAEELSRVRSMVAAEQHAGRVQHARQTSVMWRTRDGVLEDDTGGQPALFQRSVVEHEWHEFPDHAPAQPPQERAGAPVPEPSIWSERLWAATPRQSWRRRRLRTP